MVVETEDNVAYWCTLSFNSLQWDTANQRHSRFVKIIEHETVFPRYSFARKNFISDPIEKLISITFEDGTVAAVTLRESRKVDFYWRKYLVDSQDYHNH